MTKQILLVDDDDSLREQLARAFQRRHYNVCAVADTNAALEALQTQTFDYAVIDLRMPGESGLSLLARMRTCAATTQIVMLTGYGSIANAVEALRLGAVNYIAKPAHADDILAAFERNPGERQSEVNGESDLTPSLAQAEWEHIQRVLADCHGNVTQAAYQLDISRRSLQRKLRKRAP